MTTKIFVGSLPSGCKPEELRRLFEAFGVVTECDLMNRCGFVHMETADMAETAIKALNSTEFKGETINVEPGRIRGERNQKAANAGGKAGAPRPVRINNRGRMNRGGGMIPQDMKFDGIDENTTKDALQMVSAVFEEMNKMLNPPNVNQGRNRRGGGGGNNNVMALPKNFASQLEMLGGMGAPMGNMPNNRNRNRNNRNNSAGGPIQGNVGRAPNQGNVAAPQGNVGRQQNQGNAGRQQNAGNAGRAQNQGNANKAPIQGKAKAVVVPDIVVVKTNAPRNYPDRKNQGKSAERHQNQGNNAGRAPQNQNQGNAGRGPKQGNVGPIRNDPVRQRNNAAPYNRGNNSGGNMNFSDDIPVAQSARNFANNLAGGNQNERWNSNSGNFGNNNGGGGLNQLMNRNFDEDMPVTNFNNDLPINTGLGLGNLNSLSNFNSNRNNSMGNQGGYSNLGNNTGGNDRFQSGGGSNNDRFQSGNNFGMGNQDRRGFALPERQIFNDNQKFGNNQDFRGGNTQSAGLGNQGSMGGGNRDFGFGSNSNRQLESRNMGGSGGSGGMGGSDSAMFTRRNYNTGNSDGNNMGNNRMRSDNNDNTFGGNFGGNSQRGSNSGGLGGNLNSNNAGFNRNNNMGSSSNNRNMGGSGGLGMSSMGGGNNSNRNNMGGNQMGSLNFQKEFPPLSSGQNMNNRNGPRQNQNNMMSNRRW